MERESGKPPQPRNIEIRVATFVQCDIADSTRIFKGLEFEDQGTLRRAFEETVAAVAERHGGHLVRWWVQGDGAQIAFGSLQPREDAAEAAVRMALDVVDSVRAIRAVPAVQIEIRVGIASGQVAVEADASGMQQVAVDGPVPAMAERMRAAADPGSVVIDDATKRLARDYFEYHDAGVIIPKGFDEGIHAWRVLRETTFDAQRSDKTRGEIFGRDDARAQLSSAWQAAFEGRGHTVTLIGEAGLGKSSLARSALARAAEDGAATLEIDCRPGAANSPLYPIGVMLRRCAGIAAAASGSEKAASAKSYLGTLLPPPALTDAVALLAPLFGIEPEAAQVARTRNQVRDETIAAILSIVRALSAQAPLFILCEDLHWADDTTAHLVQRIAEVVSAQRTMMIVTARPGTGGIAKLKQSVGIALTPLDAASAARLVRSVASESMLSADAVAAIIARSEGVPLLLEEVTRNAVESAAAGEDVSVDASHGGDVLPELQLVVQSRLERWPQFRRVAQAASVLGREFPVPLLESILSGEPGAAASEAIHVLTEQGLFAPPQAGADRARFKHAMIWRAVYNTLLGNERRQFHARAADILQSDYQATPDAAPDVVADHLGGAHRFVEAIGVRLAASDETFRRGGFVESQGHCNAGLELVRHVTDRAEARALQLRLLNQLGVALQGSFRYADEKVEHATERARLLLSEAAADPDLVYPNLRTQFVLHLMNGKLADAFALSLQALSISERCRNPAHRVDALSVHAYATFYYGRLDDCRAGIQRCLKAYEKARGEHLDFPVAHDAAAVVYGLLPTVEWLLGNPEAAARAVTEGFAHLNKVTRSPFFNQALLHAWTAGARYTQRRYDEAAQHAGKAIALSLDHDCGEWGQTATVMALLSEIAKHPLKGPAAQAYQMLKEYDGLNASYFLWGVARGLANSGDRHSALEVIRTAFGRAEKSHDTRMNAELFILQAELESDDAAAVRVLTEGLRIADEQGAVATALRAALAIVLRSPVDAARRDTARRVLDVLDGKTACPMEIGWMQRALKDARGVIANLAATAQPA